MRAQASARASSARPWSDRRRRAAAWLQFGFAISLLAAGAGGCGSDPAPIRTYTLEDARAFYAAQPRFLQPVPHSELPKGLLDVRAESCGVCHVEIYQEWKISTHARAWLDDAQFLEEMEKTTAEKGRDASWICMNCHTPVESQLPRLVAALENGDRGRPIYVDNPHFDPKLQLEAITCATCHVRNGTVIGPWGDTKAPHAVAKGEILLSAELCTQCHEADEMLDDVNLACIFDTGTSFAAGPDAAAGRICQDCHMPEVERPLTNLKTPVRKTRRHWFGGSRIPKKPEFEAELAPMRAAYPDGARIEWVSLPPALPAGQPASLSFAITNAEAGHTLPTGDVERFLLITAMVLDDSGGVLAQRVERIGTEYQWVPKVQKLSDNRLLPRERRSYDLDFRVPESGVVRLELRGENYRMNAVNFAHHELEGRSVPGRTFFSGQDTLQIR